MKILILLFAVTLSAQDRPGTRALQIEQQRLTAYKSPLEPDEDKVEDGIKYANDHGFLTMFSGGYKGFTPVIGGMVNGSGFAGGLQFLRRDFLNGNFVFRGSARTSSKLYQLFDVEAGLPRLFDDHAYLDIYARHRNYSELPYYGPGPKSVKTGRSNYRMEDTSFDLSAGVKLFKKIRLGVTGGLLQMNVGPGTSDKFISTDKQYTPQQTPGIDRQSDYLRGGVLAHIDLRDNPYGPRSGGQYYAKMEYYDDRSWDAYSFKRLTAEAQQFVPLFNKKRVIAVRAKTMLTYPTSGQIVPFYLQPTLGASDDLRGFRPFRFYDNNMFVMNAEWRWEIVSGIEGAIFADAGKVFARPNQINFTHLERSFGGGIRFRAPMTNAMVMRMDFAASREGFQFWFVFNDIFAAPQVRTGRELSPPPGRLP